jgi:hypothetical protein
VEVLQRLEAEGQRKEHSGCVEVLPSVSVVWLIRKKRGVEYGLEEVMGRTR